MYKELLKISNYLVGRGFYKESLQIKKIAAAAEVGVTVRNGNIVSGGREAGLKVKKGIFVPVVIESIEAGMIPQEEIPGFKIVGSGLGMELTMFVTKEMLSSISRAAASGQDQYMTLNYWGPLGNPGAPKEIWIYPV